MNDICPRPVVRSVDSRSKRTVTITVYENSCHLDQSLTQLGEIYVFRFCLNLLTASRVLDVESSKTITI